MNHSNAAVQMKPTEEVFHPILELQQKKNKNKNKKQKTKKHMYVSSTQFS